MVEKIKACLLKHGKKVAVVATGVTAITTTGYCASGDIPDLTPIMTALTDAITPTSIVAMIASVIGYAMPFVLMWFGYRFLKRAFTKAVLAGRL